MTIIAYRDGVLAADSMVTFGDTCYFGRSKVFKIRGHLIGAAGKSAECHKFIEWFRSKTLKKFVAPAEGFDGFIVKPNGDAFLYLTSGILPFEGEYYATGSGADFALGAFAAGADAITAVRAAIKHNVYCGGEIHSVML
jgi:ATP-dependent protease HslVU (ClpYQ) peptidase subunit